MLNHHANYSKLKIRYLNVHCHVHEFLCVDDELLMSLRHTLSVTCSLANLIHHWEDR